MLRRRLGRLRRRYRFVRSNFFKFWSETETKERQSRSLVRFRDILDGFHPLERSWYRQARGTCEGCISNFERETSLAGLNGPHGYLLGNKLMFAHAMRSASFPHPQLFGFTHENAWVWVENGRERLADRLSRREPAVLKPINGRKGASIEFITSAAALDAVYQDDMLATEFVCQADYAATIFAGALNTLRILTVRAEGGPALIAKAVHRFGSSATRGVDNFSAGGLVARVDLDTGVLDRAFRVADGNRLEWLNRHPETDALILGVAVPCWDEVKALCLDLCTQFPFLTYVGWDIAVTKDGPVVIEGNAHPSLRFFQVYEPILHDPRLHDFFSRHLRRGQTSGTT